MQQGGLGSENGGSGGNRETPPAKPDGDSAPGGTGGPGDAVSVTYAGAAVISSDATESGTSYTSTTSAENALLVSEGNVTLNNITVSKTGDDNSGDNADFHGTNAAVLSYNGATLNLKDSEITTNGSHANALFAYGTGTVNAENVKITTTSNNSGGIMVTGGGTMNATNLTVETFGNSAAAIRSDRGGGTMNITGGTYTSNGTGSPAIYSTADIGVSRADLISTSSEGVVIEGLNSVSLSNVKLTDNNTTTNGHSETFKNIFIYQSMSGDTSEGTGTFTAENSNITTGSGDHFFITNTSAVINLRSNLFTQKDASGGFLRAQTGYWGTSGANGGIVTVNAARQDIIGDINVDKISTVNINMSESYFKGAFLGEGAKNLSVSEDSVVVLTDNSYLSSLDNAVTGNSNIYANGFTLYVAGEAVTINQEQAPESFLTDLGVQDEVITSAEAVAPTSQGGFPAWGYFAIGGGVVIAIAVIMAVLIKLKKVKGIDANTGVSGNVAGTSAGFDIRGNSDISHSNGSNSSDSSSNGNTNHNPPSNLGSRGFRQDNATNDDRIITPFDDPSTPSSKVTKEPMHTRPNTPTSPTSTPPRHATSKPVNKQTPPTGFTGFGR